MTLTKTVKLAQFTQKSLETIRGELSETILKELIKLEEILAQYQEMVEKQWDHDGVAFQYNQQQQRIVDTYYHLIRACFGAVSSRDPQIRNLYFKQEIPSTIIKHLATMKGWVERVLSLMAQPEHNHLDLFKDQLIQMKGDIDQVTGSKAENRTSRGDIASAKREICETLWNQYQTLKCYLEGWCRGNDKNHRRYFDDLRLTSAPKPKEVKEVAEVVEGVSDAPQLKAPEE